MPKKPNSETWIPLQTYFARAANYGVADVAAAEALLAALKDPESEIHAQALERTFEDRSSEASPAVVRQLHSVQMERADLADRLVTPDEHVDTRYHFGGCTECSCKRCQALRDDDRYDPPVNSLAGTDRESALTRIRDIDAFAQSFEGEREHLPRRIDPVSIPSAFWADFDSVDDACSSIWSDDDESPINSGEIDWLSGRGQSFERWGAIRREYSVVQVEREQAFAIIDALAKSDRWEWERQKDLALKEFCSRHSGVGGYEGAHKEFQNAYPGYEISRAAFKAVWDSVRGAKGPGAPRKNPPE
jgi:hypothetical protein